MRVEPDAGEGELGHVGLGDDHGAGAAQAAHRRRIGRRRRGVHENFRAGARRLAGHVEQILDADDGAVERAEAHAGARTRVRRIRLEPGGRLVDREAGTRPLPLRIGDAGKRFFEAITDETRGHDGYGLV